MSWPKPMRRCANPMPWFKVDDGLHSHAKAITAGTAALGLWVRCGSWSARHLTDGFVPTNVAREFGTASQIKGLLTSGLWRSADGGYTFHDFTDYNPTSENVKAERDAAKERQRKAREAAKAKRDAERSSGEVTDLSRRDGGVTSGEVRSPRPDPTRPEGSKEPSEEKDAPDSQDHKSTRRKPKTAAPDLFPITDAMRDWADEHVPKIDIDRETQAFLSSAKSHDRRYSDWSQAWKTWMTRPYEHIIKPAFDDPRVAGVNAYGQLIRTAEQRMFGA